MVAGAGVGPTSVVVVVVDGAVVVVDGARVVLVVDVVTTGRVVVGAGAVVVVVVGLGAGSGTGSNEQPATRTNARARAARNDFRVFMKRLPLGRLGSLQMAETLLHLGNAGGRSSRQVQGNSRCVGACVRNRGCTRFFGTRG